MIKKLTTVLLVLYITFTICSCSRTRIDDGGGQETMGVSATPVQSKETNVVSPSPSDLGPTATNAKNQNILPIFYSKCNGQFGDEIFLIGGIEENEFVSAYHFNQFDINQIVDQINNNYSLDFYSINGFVLNAKVNLPTQIIFRPTSDRNFVFTDEMQLYQSINDSALIGINATWNPVPENPVYINDKNIKTKDSIPFDYDTDGSIENIEFNVEEGINEFGYAQKTIHFIITDDLQSYQWDYIYYSDTSFNIYFLDLNNDKIFEIIQEYAQEYEYDISVMTFDNGEVKRVMEFWEGD